MPAKEDTVDVNEQSSINMSSCEVVVTGCNPRCHRLRGLRGQIHEALHAGREVGTLV